MIGTSPAVNGDPNGWIDIGNSLISLSEGLSGELDAAHATAGPGLTSAWSGPIADAYQQTWGNRRKTFDDALAQVKRAGVAIAGFGASLADLQTRAARLTSDYTSAGLHLAGDGLGFVLPASNPANLLKDAEGRLTTLWHESESEIGAIARDVSSAVSDVAGVLESVVDALEDYGLIEIGVIGFSIAEVWKGARALQRFTHFDDVAGLVKDIVDEKKDARAFVEKKLKAGARDLKSAAKELKETADSGEHEAVHVAQEGEDHAGNLIDQAKATVKEHTAQLADQVQSTADDVGDHVVSATAHGADWAGDHVGSLADNLDDVRSLGTVLAVAGAVLTVGQTVVDVGKDGLDQGVEKNLGELTELGVGIAVTAGAAVLIGTALPELVVGAALGYVVSQGVGDLVQHTANDHKQGTYQVINDVAKVAPYAAPLVLAGAPL